MDPLSTTASVIAVLQLSSEVVKYVNSAAGATKERARLRKEVRACEDILQQLKDEADDSDEGKVWSETIKALEAPGAPLGRLRVALDIVKVKLMPKEGLKNAVAKLRWPFDEKEMEKTLVAIEREKSLLELALTNNCRKLLQEIKKSSNENRRQLAELIEAVERSSEENGSQFAKLNNSLGRVKGSQADLKDSLNCLRGRQDNREGAEERKAILNWLTSIDYAPQQSDFINRRQAGTGQWLLDSEEFRTWVEAEKQTLFCPGIPGAGKTILTSIVVDDLTTRFGTEESIGIAYLYCNFRQQDKQNVEHLLASILKQLVQGRLSLPESVKSLYDKHKDKWTPSVNEISRALQSVAPTYQRIFIIADALDECQVSNGRSRFLSEIFSLQGNTGLNIFVTSRPLLEIETQFSGCLWREIRARDEDVRRYLGSHVLRLSGFLLAQLHLNSLTGKRTVKSIRTALKTLPKGSKAYDQAYEDAMNRIEEQGGAKELAKQVLSWITCAKRPLTITELQHALAVEVDEPELDEENLLPIEDIVSECVGLVTVDEESGIIRLVHYTAQEYFERTQKKWFPDAEADITISCVTYLSFEIFENGICQSDDEFEERLRSHQLYDYAAHNWGHHAREALISSQATIDCLENIAKIEEMSQSVVEYLESEAKVEASSQALLALLLDKGADVDIRGGRYGSALQMASLRGYEKIVQLLLEKGADINIEGGGYGSPLRMASLRGHKKIVQLLLEKGADVNIEGGGYGSPLRIALLRGHEKIVQLLLDRGPDVNIEGGGYGSALQIASSRGYEKIVQLLLEKVADVNIEGGGYGSPLRIALLKGHEKIVQLLLEKGADVNIKDRYYGSALQIASSRGYEKIVQLLLDRGADINIQDGGYGSALLSASSRGYEKIVQLLLDKGAGVNAQGGIYGSALQAASWGGYEKIVQLLLDKGADINAQSKYYDSALQAASPKGHEKIVQLLLDEGADVNSQGGIYGAALQAASWAGHEKIVQLLLDKGADVNAQGRDRVYNSALQIASSKGHKKIVQLLLDKEADVNATTSDGLTPLY
ncbi:hypothetical protein DL768_001533 [Monosporascus sp. mg162]|nr:hypothetical protein DL768_001533 [Monosporascus sp. mg162]